ncbi:MAG: hypothetical protein CMG66_02385 [Candidatus Marinimicrobia bacterium]|nr:hypothetical protein [Candidatus Neomarinimicrobiota bacterium]|tara:strand:- start:14195 stop:14668 length:474 start_codon:yes stop_codon:yes gene_type:complete
MKPEYLKQNCTLTLQEGLEEYYSCNPIQIKHLADKLGPFFINHDITHVIFGLGTSIYEESLLDTWTLRGTDITWNQIYQYAFNPDLMKITKSIIRDNGGWIKVIVAIARCIPLKLKIHFSRIPRMHKKWPFSNVTKGMLSRPICDLRAEYGIFIINS